MDQEALDWAEDLRQSKGYAISQKMRKRIEHLFGEAKEQMGLRRARRRGFKNVEEQCLMTALAQNIKRIVLAKPGSGRKALIFMYDYATLAIKSMLIAPKAVLNAWSNILIESLNQQEAIYGN
jgi:hypothetical protein